MDNNPLNGAVVIEDYQPITGCESDDSRSSISRSDDNEPIPSIIYTSDDSADVAPSPSTYSDSDGISYIAQNICPGLDDATSCQLLLQSGCPTRQQSPQPTDFLTHPLNSLNFNKANEINSRSEESNLVCCVNKNPLFPERTNLQVNPDKGLARIPSVSTTTSELSPEVDQLLQEYRPLSEYSDHFAGLSFATINSDPIKAKVMQEQLDKLVTDKDTAMKQCPAQRFFVGDIHIDSQYKDAFYMKWNWKRIRSACALMHFSILVSLLCVGVALLVQMPRGSECDPVQEWWQGSVAYHVFVPSFKDSDGDGIGDINGIISKLDYIQHTIGARVLRLSPVFDSNDLVSPTVRNYTQVSPSFGVQNDLHLLSVLLHQRGMHLILDLPLTAAHPSLYHSPPQDDFTLPSEFSTLQPRGSEPVFMKSQYSELVDFDDVPYVLKHWLNLGIDGFNLIDLHLLIHKKDLHLKVQQWRNMLDRYAVGLTAPVLMVPSALLEKLDSKGSVHVHYFISLVNLIDVTLDMTLPMEQLLKRIDTVRQWEDHPSLPWINWNFGNLGLTRTSEHSNNTNLSHSLLVLSLPGTVTLYYGDELAIKGPELENDKDVSWAALMQWSDEDNSGFSQYKPWMPQNNNWLERNVVAFNSSLQQLQKMVVSRQTLVPLYVNGVFREVDGRMKKTSNFKIRYKKDNLLVIERHYPRRQHFAIVANLDDEEAIEKDLSNMYYGGEILATSSNIKGYIQFKHINIQPNEVFVCSLDI